MAEALGLVVSCEHASNHIPARYAKHFASVTALAALASHRGWDPGSLALGRQLSRTFVAPIFATRVSRLLIEVNRSPSHRNLFSEFSNGLLPSERQRLMKTYYESHRGRVTEAIREMLAAKRHVLHLSVHTFTPVMDGVVRTADVGLLYDPRRPGEASFANRWRAGLRDAAPTLRVRRNYPYLGVSDGFTTMLRRLLRSPRYLGIELEVNQRFVEPSRRAEWRQLCSTLCATLARLL